MFKYMICLFIYLFLQYILLRDQFHACTLTTAFFPDEYIYIIVTFNALHLIKIIKKVIKCTVYMQYVPTYTYDYYTFQMCLLDTFMRISSFIYAKTATCLTSCP